MSIHAAKHLQSIIENVKLRQIISEKYRNVSSSEMHHRIEKNPKNTKLIFGKK